MNPYQECTVHQQCGGCPQYQHTTEQTTQRKRSPIVEWLGKHSIKLHPTIHSFEWSGFRDRCDLQYHNGSMGLYQRNTNTIVPISCCPKVHNQINKAILWLHNHPLPIKKASLCIRRAPDNTIGIWIDTSNINISILLKESMWIANAQEHFIIELGQRHKRPKKTEHAWGLHKHPVFFPWFETPICEQESTSIYSTIASFTQPSMKSNQTLVHTVRKLVSHIQCDHWLEYGCGSGNFTFMLSQHVQTLDLVEVNPIAKKGLKRGLEDVSTGATIAFTDAPISEYSCQAILLDPPRSGMGKALTELCHHPTCTDIIYVSCQFQSMSKEMEQLQEYGFELQSITGIDQFPKSDHCEWVAHLSNKKSVCDKEGNNHNNPLL